jgi:phosphoribosylanthranilate isomerase
VKRCKWLEFRDQRIFSTFQFFNSSTFKQKKQKMKIKICGITEQGNMMKIAGLGPDYLGFIFYPPSPRDVTEKIEHLSFNLLPAEIKKVAVLVDMPLQKAIRLVDKYSFDLVQLHGNESRGYCLEMKKYTEVIKVFRVKDQLPDNLDLYQDCCNYILFDTKADLPGGTGLSFNHGILENYPLDIPFFLSGGIGPETTNEVLSLGHPMLQAVDVNSKFEIKPGIKNISLIKDFIRKIKHNNPI